MSKWLAHHWPELDVDVVEVDPSVLRVAEEYFEYRPPANHRLYAEDARVFLRSKRHGSYDIIWVDVFARRPWVGRAVTRNGLTVCETYLEKTSTGSSDACARIL